jgi:ubiquinone/menaquinone biosynthesis C-methylase UbiE
VSHDPLEYAKSLGYREEELRSLPEGLVCHGCGNPIFLAGLKPGEAVLDLGSGGGLDVFLASKEVGPRGKVIGVDSSAETVAKAMAAATQNGYTNVEFMVGSMEDLPLEDQSADVVVSNCVINHAADKRRVFAELFRCLRPGGRIAVTDLLAEGEFSEAAKTDKVWGEWLAHASGKQDYLNAIKEAGFRNVTTSATRWQNRTSGFEGRS